MRPVFHRVGRYVRTARGLFPLTLPGLLLLVVCLASFWWIGVGRMDMVVLAASSVGIFVLFLMLVLVVLAALVTHRRWTRSRMSEFLEVTSAQKHDTGFAAPFPRLFPFAEYAVAWDQPRNVDVSFEKTRSGRFENIVPLRRGRHSSIVRRLTVRDFLGLTAVTWARGDSVDLKVVPHSGQLDRMPLLEGLVGGEDVSHPLGDPHGDRVDMRQYTHGDSPRMILWKVFARTRKLLVRVPERAVTARPRSCGYLIAGEGDEPTAGLAKAFIERGGLGENWRFGADGDPRQASNAEEAVDGIVNSGSAPDDMPTGFPEFLTRAQNDGFSTCYLFVPPAEGPWTTTALDAVARTSLRVHILTAIDGPPLEFRPPSLLRRLLFRPADARLHGDLRKLVRRLSSGAFPVTVVDRICGRVIPL